MKGYLICLIVLLSLLQWTCATETEASQANLETKMDEDTKSFLQKCNSGLKKCEFKIRKTASGTTAIICDKFKCVRVALAHPVMTSSLGTDSDLVPFVANGTYTMLGHMVMTPFKGAQNSMKLEDYSLARPKSMFESVKNFFANFFSSFGSTYNRTRIGTYNVTINENFALAEKMTPEGQLSLPLFKIVKVMIGEKIFLGAEVDSKVYVIDVHKDHSEIFHYNSDNSAPISKFRITSDSSKSRAVRKYYVSSSSALSTDNEQPNKLYTIKLFTHPVSRIQRSSDSSTPSRANAYFILNRNPSDEEQTVPLSVLKAFTYIEATKVEQHLSAVPLPTIVV